MKKLLNILSVSFATVIAMGVIVSCEDETLGLGNNVIGGEAEGNVIPLDVIAYNDVADTIRSDRSILQNATFGAYSEPVFGSTSSKFYAQFRPTSIGNKDFGKETKVDSVNLYIPVYYKSNAEPVSVKTINLTNPGKEATDKDLVRTITEYAIDSIYGNKDLKMTLKVRDINTVLFRDTKYFSKLDGSSSPISTNEREIGTASVGKTVTVIEEKVKGEATAKYSEPVAFKISLDPKYFDEKIIKNAQTGMLADYSTFIRENIRGFEFSVDEQDGFIVNINPNKIDMKMYYSYKNPNEKTEGQTDYKERLDAVYGFDFTNQWNATVGNNSNVLLNQIVNNTKGSKYESILATKDVVNGDSRLYLSGMSGSFVNLKVNPTQLDNLRTLRNQKGIVIVGAKLQFFIDEDVKFPKPPYITAWNQYKKDGKLVDEMFYDSKFQRTPTEYFYNSYPASVHFNPMVKGSTDRYTIDITGHLKEMLEKKVVFEEQTMKIAMGNFIINPSISSYYGDDNPYRLDRAYNPYRIVLHGNNTEVEAKKLKLLVYYAAK